MDHSDMDNAFAQHVGTSTWTMIDIRTYEPSEDDAKLKGGIRFGGGANADCGTWFTDPLDLEVDLEANATLPNTNPVVSYMGRLGRRG